MARTGPPIAKARGSGLLAGAYTALSNWQQGAGRAHGSMRGERGRLRLSPLGANQGRSDVKGKGRRVERKRKKWRHGQAEHVSRPGSADGDVCHVTSPACATNWKLCNDADGPLPPQTTAGTQRGRAAARAAETQAFNLEGARRAARAQENCCKRTEVPRPPQSAGPGGAAAEKPHRNAARALPLHSASRLPPQLSSRPPWPLGRERASMRFACASTRAACARTSCSTRSCCPRITAVSSRCTSRSSSLISSLIRACPRNRVTAPATAPMGVPTAANAAAAANAAVSTLEESPPGMVRARYKAACVQKTRVGGGVGRSNMQQLLRVGRRVCGAAVGRLPWSTPAATSTL
jgi:hypothetical protein